MASLVRPVEDIGSNFNNYMVILNSSRPIYAKLKDEEKKVLKTFFCEYKIAQIFNLSLFFL